MKEWIAYIAFLVAAFLFGLLPESAARSFGTWAGERASKRKRARRTLLAGHMRRVLGPGSSEIEIAEAVDGMYRSYGRYWAETLWFRPRRRDTILKSVRRVNFGPVLDAKAAGRGIIFALPHIGNWEIAGLIAEEMDLNLMAVAEHLPNERITRWFLTLRAKLGIEIVLTSDPDRRSRMIRHLKEGGALALLADRDVTRRGISVDFFGEETTVPSGPTALAESTGSALIPVAVYFNDGPGYTIVVGDSIILPVHGTRSERIRGGAQLVVSVLEEMIREKPSQWHLFQPNWPSDWESDTQASR